VAIIGGLRGVGLELLRLIVWLVLLAAIFVPLERLAGHRRQKVLRPRLLLDASYYFLNSLLLFLFLAIPLAGVAWLLHFVVPGAVQTWTGSWPGPARFVAALVFGELGGYWGHRWLHEVPFLWRFHAVHHSAEQIDWLVNSRAHPLDLAFTRICGYIPLYALGLLNPFASATDPAFMAFVIVGTIWAFFIHANLRWRFGWLEYLLVTPAFHHWHHTRHDHINHNYATVLPWMDAIFGTFHLPRGRWPDEYGADEPVPDDLAGQLLYPVHRAER
jgi:sterol desaturase/sphingolipid hydroxylase (fatty acid hydroxylase superfamily)